MRWWCNFYSIAPTFYCALHNDVKEVVEIRLFVGLTDATRRRQIFKNIFTIYNTEADIILYRNSIFITELTNDLHLKIIVSNFFVRVFDYDC
jgi:hypothetical protein